MHPKALRLLIHFAAGTAATQIEPAVYAQVSDLQPTGTAISSLDAFGNAEPIDVERRPLATFDEAPRQGTIRGYQLLTQRLSARGGVLLSDPVSRNRGLATVGQYARRQAAKAAATKGAFDQYGGFERRLLRGPSDLTTALTRKNGLVRSLSHIGPVHRALTRSGSGFSRPSAPYQGAGPILSTPRLTVGDDAGVGMDIPFGSDKVTQEQDPVNSDAPPLSRILRTLSKQNASNALPAAWGFFKNGEYHKSRRAFMAIQALDPGMGEARVGEVFSYLGSGSTASSIAALSDLSERVGNPFLIPISMQEKFGRIGTTNDLRTRARFFVQSSVADPFTTGLYTFALWFLGEKEEALSAADALARANSSSVFSTWPAKMREALSFEQPIKPTP